MNKGSIRTGLKAGASVLALTLFGVALPLITNAGGASAAGPCGPPVVSVIACENTLLGVASTDWLVAGAGDQTLQGFATSMSVNVGQTVSFKISSTQSAYHIDILRLGYYQCTVACPPGNPRAYKAAYSVSYTRPFHTALDDGGRDWLTYAEWPMLKYLEANGYDVSYVAAKDVDTGAALLTNHKMFMSTGHDEYWSANQRANVTAARDAGVKLAFFSGNEGFWKTRFASSSHG